MTVLAALAVLATLATLAARDLEAATHGKGPDRPAPKATLVFFMNPAGSPCQRQDRILGESRSQWEPLAALRYARTDVPSDRELFYKFGVRSLPSLILVGADGRELFRYSPGIQPAESVLAGIRNHPGR
jgi:hypothetical protein